METMDELKPGVRNEIITLIDKRIEERFVDKFPSKEDFSELKGIVIELAKAQQRTEIRVEELAEAQKRTELQIRNLAVNVGKLSDNIGYGLEDIAHVILPGYLERNLGIKIKGFSREFIKVDNREVEINLYGVGKRKGKEVTVLGECKSRIYRREVRSFLNDVKEVRPFIKGDVQLIIFGYLIHPSASEVADKEGIHPIVSYQR